MTQKVELINKKIDEINQRRLGLRTTRIEDDLDRQELDEYIKSLNLTPEQKKILEGYNRNNQRPVRQPGFNSLMMLISVFIEAYIGYAIIQFYMSGSLGTSITNTTDLMNSIYLYLMVIVFIVNAFYILKYLRIIR